MAPRPESGLLVDASVMEPMFLVPANRSIARQQHRWDEISSQKRSSNNTQCLLSNTWCR
ncbi:hypothetical protein MES5069_40040 [Mesorhizobium escarrei]|uniref:Uncharacterized protein n=1 Tax=Mesorhizobium escarrei TaxID=666018 RepID=A0ABM9E3N2_9HYPH|nr:hypothetical protein MES5069_40040 [Mesorhizobium escarrei]